MAYGLPYGMALHKIIICSLLPIILYLLIGSKGSEVPRIESEPEFQMPLENYTVPQGREVVFTCVVNHLQSYKVAWIKSDSRAILAIHTHMVAHNPRLSVTHNGFDTWKLHVANVQANDSGTYMCQVNTDPMRSQTGYMNVVIPPDIMDLDENSDRLTTEEKGEISLRCNATGTPEPEITWRREDGKNITLRDKKEQQVVKIHKGKQLHLTGILRQEMGSYLCIASNGIPPTVSKRYYVNVLFKPTVTIDNQLIAAPIDKKVSLFCSVESSPKSLNVWYKDDVKKILPSEKYDVQESQVNDYTFQSNLTIKNLKLSDFGRYSCFSENAHGKDQVTIRLQELHLEKTTVTPIRSTELSGIGHKKYNLNEKNGRKYNMNSLGREKSQNFLGKVEKSNNSIQAPRTKLSKAVATKILNPPSSHPALSPASAHFPPVDFEMYNNNAGYFCLNWLRIIVILLTLLISF
ncbi:protein CEPU-1-like [Leptopilina heterotoma]|uniref:protein CEPU-1-like n=1 Tax=Leptopilina heterotoma TaxID=63436 RepID=UPI001CA7E635|nr:protein CEPU-1-like [Leptopilina heterotoma]XP_043483117.1 protein CEPU-1-like [Leptopilina heterotoma]